MITKCLLWWSRVVDHKVWLKANLQDPSCKEGCLRLPNYLREAACGSGLWYEHHPVQQSRWMYQRSPLLWPPPRQSWHQCWCRGLLPDVFYEFLGAGLVPRPVKLNVAQRVTCIVCYYYLSMYYYYILLRNLLLLVITVLLLHYYYNIIKHYYIIHY